jgi:hypothetical protein
MAGYDLVAHGDILQSLLHDPEEAEAILAARYGDDNLVSLLQHPVIPDSFADFFVMK